MCLELLYLIKSKNVIKILTCYDNYKNKFENSAIVTQAFIGLLVVSNESHSHYVYIFYHYYCEMKMFIIVINLKIAIL